MLWLSSFSPFIKTIWGERWKRILWGRHTPTALVVSIDWLRDYRVPYVTPAEMGLMSLFVYAGSAQFAMPALIAVQAPVAAIAMTAFFWLICVSFCWVCMRQPISVILVLGTISVCLVILTDETYGVLMGELAHADKVNPKWMHGNNLTAMWLGLWEQ